MSVNSMTKIRELSKEEMGQLYPLIRQSNEGLNEADFTRYLTRMQGEGYRCVGAFSADKLLGAIGFWLHTRFWAGTYMEVDNVVVDEAARGMGIGTELSRWVDEEAKRLGCSRVMAAVYTSNTDAHRFYTREQYSILGFYFTKKLG